ncbi:MAG TPA: hypothetical protein VJ464_12530 [Blastocatellia bacterium]|nr:hypothetical protein [Blastocatellia bacterium]
MRVMNVLLVLVGALGDLAWRKFLVDAKAMEAAHPDVSVLLVDVPWRNAGLPLDQELRLRIGQRLIELRAEKVNLRSNIGNTPLPWEVEEFVTTQLNTGDANREREGLEGQLSQEISWFTEKSRAGHVRYCSDPVAATEIARTLKDSDWKIAVFVATPPDAYPAIIKQWSRLADRIVLEKPASGLGPGEEPGSLVYPGTGRLRDVAKSVTPPAQIATNDHYNAKLITRALDRIRDYHLFDYWLDPSRIKRIRVELLEPAPLPLGRCGFYNGAGGAFGDMVPHLLQAVRALLGLTPDTLKVRFGDEFYWGRYKDAPLAGSFVTPVGYPYQYNPGYYQPLNEQTETFVAFEAKIEIYDTSRPGKPPAEIDLYCRTGKGFSPAHKSISVDVEYSPSGVEARLIFNFENGDISVRDDRGGFLLATGKLQIDEPFQSGIPWVDKGHQEYKGIFKALVSSEWKADALNSRYFPTVTDAADLCDIVYQRLIAERAKRIERGEPLLTYEIGDVNSCLELMKLLDEKAHW